MRYEARITMRGAMKHLGEMMKHLGGEPGIKAGFSLLLMTSYLTSAPEETRAQSMLFACGFSLMAYLFLAEQKIRENRNVRGDALLFGRADNQTGATDEVRAAPSLSNR